MKKVECAVYRITPGYRDKYHYFFGYYDKCPWNKKGDRILMHRTNFVDRFPNPNDHAEIGYISPNGGSEFVKIADTTAWNWQQGSQLQCLSDEEKVVYNDRQEGQLITVILDLVTCEKHIIETPIYTVSPSGRYALSLNYARLFDMRKEYGISGLEDRWHNVLCPEDDGIYIIDLQTGTTKLIISIAQAAAVDYYPMGEGAKHWVNHMMFNPSGRRFCFLHRFLRGDKIMHSRLLTANLDGSDLRLLFKGMVSHYSWKDDTAILTWAGKRKILGDVKRKPSLFMMRARRCLKPIYYAMGKPRILMQKVIGDSFYIIEDKVNGTVERFAFGKLASDGHCTFSPNRKWILTDGYTDSMNRLPLFLYDIHKEAVLEIGRFPTPKALHGPLRVDLHPRFNRDGTKICIDSAMDGSRQMYVIDVSEVIGSV